MVMPLNEIRNVPGWSKGNEVSSGHSELMIPTAIITYYLVCIINTSHVSNHKIFTTVLQRWNYDLLSPFIRWGPEFDQDTQLIANLGLESRQTWSLEYLFFSITSILVLSCNDIQMVQKSEFYIKLYLYTSCDSITFFPLYP